MSAIHGNKIFVINYTGVIFGIAHSLKVTTDYGHRGIYDFSKKRELENGNTKVAGYLTATLHGLLLDFGDTSQICMIRVEDLSGNKMDYQVVGEKIKGKELTFPVWLCKY